MKNIMILICVLLLGCGISPANQAGVDNHHSDKPKQLKLEWQYSLFSQVSASPVVADGQLFVAAENGNLYSFNLDSKQFNWLYHTEAGIASTPRVVNGRIYFLSRDGFFYALEQSTGKRLWRFATGGEARFAAIGGYGLPAAMGPVPDPWDFYLSSPLVHKGKVYFGSSDHHLYALDALTGELIWSFDAGDSIHSSPVYANNTIFFGTWGTRLYAVNAETGLEVWNCQGGADREYSVMLGITAAPAVDANSVYIGARDGFVYALRQTDGATLWRYDAAGSWVLSTAAIDEKNIYVGTSDTGLFLALDKKTGTEKYR
ncbi:MAG TPA: PQQ-binding-like beta-propeller repeat protein, partial [Cellvibrio sp.]